MKKIILALVLLFAPTLAWGQCNGVYTSNQVCGSVAGGVPGPVNIGALGTIRSVTVQFFIAGGTYTPHAGIVAADITCVGGGGAGGGAPSTGASQATAGGGGAAGGIAEGVFTAAAIGVGQTIVIGGAGSGITGATGNNGGQTTFGTTLLVANGGAGGTVGTASTGNTIIGGAGGGSATGGYLQINGQAGWDGWSIPGSASTALAQGGAGASNMYGGGGTVAMTTTSTINGVGAVGFGAGGSGAAAGASQAGTSPGGNASPGMCLIKEYNSQ